MSICKPCAKAADVNHPEYHDICEDCPCQHVTGKEWEDLYTVTRKDNA